MDKKTRKIMTMHKTLRLRDYIDRQYLSRKEGRGLANIEDHVDTLIRLLEDSKKKKE